MLQELGPKQRDRYHILFSVPAPTFLCHIYLPFTPINKTAPSPLLHIFQGNLFPLAHSQPQFGLPSIKNIFPLGFVFCPDGEGNKFCNKQYQHSIKTKCKINTIKDSFKKEFSYKGIFRCQGQSMEDCFLGTFLVFVWKWHGPQGFGTPCIGIRAVWLDL